MKKYSLSIIGGEIKNLNRDNRFIKEEIYNHVTWAINYGIDTFYLNYKTEFDLIVMDVLFEIKNKYKYIKIGVITINQIVFWDEKMYKHSSEIMKNHIFPPLCALCFGNAIEKMVSNSNFCLVFWDGKNDLINNSIIYAKNNGCVVKVIFTI